MIQNVLQTLGGIERYGIVSLLLFFAVFGGAVLWAMSLKKQHLNEMAKLPLTEEEPADRTKTL